MSSSSVKDTELVLLARQAIANGDQHSALALLDKYIATNPTLSDDQIITCARDAQQKRFEELVQRAVGHVVDIWINGNFEDGDLDNACSVEYHDDAYAILRFSDNTTAGHREHGADAFDWDGDLPWCPLATYALRADVIETLRVDHGIEKFNDPPREEVRRCKCCDEWLPLNRFKESYEDGDDCRDCQGD